VLSAYSSMLNALFCPKLTYGVQKLSREATMLPTKPGVRLSALPFAAPYVRSTVEKASDAVDSTSDKCFV
jgi:hypothetical protein